MKKVRKAVIPAAGLGTRFLPYTKAEPKEMLPIVDTPTIQYIIEEALSSGIEDILVITGHNKKSIEDHFDKSYELEAELEKAGKEEMLKEVQKISNLVNIHFIRQKEAKGLGHAINCARAFVGDEPFAVLLGDDVVFSPEKPCLMQLVDVYNQTGGSVLGVQTVPHSEIRKYGCVDGEKINERTYRVLNLVEKPKIEEAPSDVAILGRYIITPEIFSILSETAPGAGGEIQLTDALRTLSAQKSVYAYEFTGRRYDVGDKQGFLEATVEHALRRDDLKDKFAAYLKKIAETL